MSLPQRRAPNIPIRERLAVSYRNAAQMLDVSERTVRRMVDCGELDGERLMGCPRVTVSSLLRRMGEGSNHRGDITPSDAEADTTAREIERRLVSGRV